MLSPVKNHKMAWDQFFVVFFLHRSSVTCDGGGDRPCAVCDLTVRGCEKELLQCTTMSWWRNSNSSSERLIIGLMGGTKAAVPPSDPALCGSRPLLTPYYCRLGDLLCFVFMSDYCMFDLSVYYMYLQYFDTVGWVYRVGQIKWHHFAFLLVTHECIHKILWFLAPINYIMQKIRW